MTCITIPGECVDEPKDKPNPVARPDGQSDSAPRESAAGATSGNTQQSKPRVEAACEGMWSTTVWM